MIRPTHLILVLAACAGGCASWLPPGQPRSAAVNPRPLDLASSVVPAAETSVEPLLAQARNQLEAGSPLLASSVLARALTDLADRSGPDAGRIRLLWGDVEMAQQHFGRAAIHYQAALMTRDLADDQRATLTDRTYLALRRSGDATAEVWQERLRQPSWTRLKALEQQLLDRAAPARKVIPTGLHRLAPEDTRDIVPGLRLRPTWNARPTGPSRDRMTAITRVTVHHSACCSATTTVASAAEALRTIQEKHQFDHGWADIGYHFVIDAGGRVWEGRPLRFQGAHAGSPQLNVGNIGVCLLGNFDTEPLPAIQRQALVRLLGSIRGYFDLPPRWLVTHKEIRPRPTRCPGWGLQAFVDSYRTSAAASLALQ